MPWKQEPAQWEPEQYPKMLTKKDEDGNIKPVVYPAGHEKQGLPVIFENEDDEKAYGRPAVKKSSKKD